MANFVFNIAKGSIRKRIQDGADLRMLVLKSAGTDATLKDLDTVAAVLGAGSTTEADFTNYARKTLTGESTSVDDTADVVRADFDNVTFTAAGGATNNTTTDVIIYQHVTNDSDSIPLVMLDAVFTTDGNDVNLQLDANGFWESGDA